MENGGHFISASMWYCGGLSWSQVIVIHMEIAQLYMKSSGAWSSDEMQWLD